MLLATPAKVTWLSLDLARAGISATSPPLVFSQATNNCSTSVSEEDMIQVMILVFYDVE